MTKRSHENRRLQESVTSRKCEMKGRVCEICLGRRGGSSYGVGGRGMRSCCSTTSQILGPPGIGFSIFISDTGHVSE